MTKLFKDPAPRTRAYVGSRVPKQAGPGKVERVELNLKRTVLPKRLDLRSHSPDGFQWGYSGSGPAQLALALAADATGDDELALRVYQDLKREIVAGLPDLWQLDAGNIADFCHSLAAKRVDG